MQPSMEQIISLCKRRGFIFQASDIYGGLSGFWDYGPLGVELANNLKATWWNAMVHDTENIFGIDGAIIQSPKLWDASGHVAGFTDPLVEDLVTHKRYRADHLAGVDSNDVEELQRLLSDKKSPDGNPLGPVRTFNMMMKTFVGPIEDTESIAYLRPETAGAIFVNYKNILDTMRAKLPFGIAQIGKAFRNEISPRDFIFRVRELEQMEMQYFIWPKDQDASYEQWRTFAHTFLIEQLGINPENIMWHEHADDERAHYAAAAHDIYFKFPQGFKELWGTHNRTDFDLESHMRHSGAELTYFDEESKERFVPYVIESSVGLGRMLLAVLTDAYTEVGEGDDKHIVLKLKPSLAPYKATVSPLLKNKPELVAKAREVFMQLKKKFGTIAWDDNGNIGKRYRRADEIGTPYCIVIDFDTIGDPSKDDTSNQELLDTVTVRDRDTGTQARIPIAQLAEFLTEKIEQ